MFWSNRDPTTRVRKVLLSFAGLLFCMGAIWMVRQKHMTPKPSGLSQLQVVFPMSVLRPTPVLLDSTRLDTVFEYYLLENLAAGLVRDDTADPSGYQPVLAKSWTHPDSKSWVFLLQDHLSWSDGSDVTSEQLQWHFLRLKTENHRHLTYFKHLESVTFDPKEKRLELRFNQPTGSGILHELSLADAALLHPSNLKESWTITSGPYTVEKYDLGAKELILRKNAHCPLVTETSPKSIRLFALKSGEDVSKVFREIQADLFYMPIPAFQPKFAQVLANAPKTITGQPTTIHFFYFDGSDPQSANLAARQEFAFLVDQALKDVRLPKYLKAEHQLVPMGFAGRLEHVEPATVEIKTLHGQSITLNLHPSFESFPEFSKALESAAQRSGVTIHIDYSAYQADKPKKPYFSQLAIFKGNQKDALGSWSFLFSDGVGELAYFRKSFEPFFQSITGSDSEEARAESVRNLHREVLRQVVAVPFLIEPSRILTSARIDLSRWNSFDMRLRFYSIQVEE